MTIFTNGSLFSHTYLDRLKNNSAQDDSLADIVHTLRGWIGARDTSSIQALRDSWIEPLLNALELQSRPEELPHIYSLSSLWTDEQFIGLCYVVPFGRDLGETTKGRHAMAQIVLALREEGLRWGILTNGRHWRLVDAQSLRRYEHHIEFDLDELARSNDPAPLRIFYACFHSTAFSADGNGTPGLEELCRASEQATQAAEQHLKARISHSMGIMARLCQGFVDADGRSQYADHERDVIYRDATTLLYRILFILYAEARALLPVHNEDYQQVSLSTLIKIAYTYKLHGMPNPKATTLWLGLRQLCAAIYESDATLGIPAYNGGLFDDANKPHLRDGHISDAYLADALFDLAYQPDQDLEDGYRLIDYRDLSVRHLGSIYEAMIEYKLFIAEEPMLARQDNKGNVHYLTLAQVGAARRTDQEIKTGEVYFAQSAGERRATGTYYTPEHIVNYIVYQAAIRALEERRRPLEEKLRAWLGEIAVAPNMDERARMQRTVDQELLHFVEEQVLTFRMCDPGMGSGHFLVNGGHQITNFIIETLHLTPWENPDLDADPAAWRRKVVSHCLYGVDINLMAVELAKLSLWLASVDVSKPLSFLDHHLRHGNSLIGTQLEDLAQILTGTGRVRPSRKERKAQKEGQLSWFGDPSFNQHIAVATDLLTQISDRIAERLEDVRAQEADYEQVRTELEIYRQLADIWTARRFGLDVTESQIRDIFTYLVDGSVSQVPQYESLLAYTRELSERYRFFHWQLEFPEVSWSESDQKGPDRSGFDALVGNPPYDVLAEKERAEDLQALMSYFEEQPDLQPALGRKVDLYRLFVAKALNLPKTYARLGFIVPMSILTDLQTLPLRRHILDKHGFVRINAFPQKDDPRCRVFPGAKLPTSVVIIQREPEDIKPFQVFVHPGRSLEEISGSYLATPKDIVAFSRDAMLIPLLTSELALKLITELSNADKFEPMGEHLQTYQGEINETTMRGLLSQNSSAGPKVLRGGNVQRYAFIEQARQGVDKHIDVKEYERTVGGKRVEHTRQYRIGYQRNAALNNWRRLIFAPMPVPSYCFDSISYYVVGDERIRGHFFLALLNSELMNWRFTITSTNNHVSTSEIATLPLRKIHFTTPVEERKQLMKEGQHVCNQCFAEGNQDLVVGFIERQLEQEPERADVIHDLLACLAEQMIDLHRERQRLEDVTDLFRFVNQNIPCVRIDNALGASFSSGEMICRPTGLSLVRHDIEGLQLTRQADGRWLLQVRAKLRDPETAWRKPLRDKEGNVIRRWLSVYHLPMDDEMGYFYHYAFANLAGFDGAGRFPGGSTRTMLQKLYAAKVPQFVPVDLNPLAELEVELNEVKRRIQFTDELIDQIVYKLYGLTEEEIAIVEGRK